MTLPERLRSETRTRHEELESAFRLPHTIDDHKLWLEKFLGFLEPLEQRLDEVMAHATHLLEGRRKSAWLREDLRQLGHTEEEIAAVPRCRDLPAVNSFARALGALYVFEGATLGGLIISRHLEQVLGLRDGVGYRYFLSYGPQVGQQWANFRALLLRHSSANADVEVVGAANETFVRLRDWSVAPS